MQLKITAFGEVRNTMNKQESKKLKQKVINVLLANGFVRTLDKMYEYHGFGSKGFIVVSVKDDKRYRRRGYEVSVFGLFADVDKARAAEIDCNPYSGKHNFIFIESHQVDYIIEQYL